AENLPDARVLVVLQPEFGERLLDVRLACSTLDRVESHAETSERTTAVNIARPSSLQPVNESTACSGCGIRPTTLPASLQMPAMSRADPFGLPPRYRKTIRPSASSVSRVRSSAT